MNAYSYCIYCGITEILLEASLNTQKASICTIQLRISITCSCCDMMA